MSALLHAALAAAERGWRVFPLRFDDKRPAVKAWEARATTDHARIERCWSTGPFNVGIACGPSGLVVIDLDTPKPGTEVPPEWCAEGVRTGLDVLAVLAERADVGLPVDTYSVRTASSGEHLYYTAPHVPKMRNTAGRLGWLVDTRAAGGYVVGAGSIVDGREYTVLDNATPAVLPSWLTDALGEADTPTTETTGMRDLLRQVRRRSAYAGAVLRGELDTVLAARPGSRNHTLNASAYALGRHVGAGLIPEPLAAQALEQAGRAIGLSQRECVATVRSGLAAGARHPRTA